MCFALLHDAQDGYNENFAYSPWGATALQQQVSDVAPVKAVYDTQI